MPLHETAPRASPTIDEVEILILQLYPGASTRHAILHSIHDHVDRMRKRGDANKIPAYLQRELEAMNAELEAQQKGKRRKLYTIAGKVGLTALAIASHWHW